jgi:membrane protease YdiL (CAAX protease family)
LTGWAHYAPIPVSGGSVAVGGAIESGVLEEVLFRLILLRLLWRALGVWPALALSALFFGGAHLFNPGSSWFAALCIAVEAGILLAVFYILTGRLWVSLGLHAGWNFTEGWLLGSPVSGTRDFVGGPIWMHATSGVPAWMSGGTFGPEASVGTLLICTVVGLWILWIAWRKGRMGDQVEGAGPL